MIHLLYMYVNGLFTELIFSRISDELYLQSTTLHRQLFVVNEGVLDSLCNSKGPFTHIVVLGFSRILSRGAICVNTKFA